MYIYLHNSQFQKPEAFILKYQFNHKMLIKLLNILKIYASAFSISHFFIHCFTLINSHTLVICQPKFLNNLIREGNISPPL